MGKWMAVLALLIAVMVLVVLRGAANEAVESDAPASVKAAPERRSPSAPAEEALEVDSSALDFDLGCAGLPSWRPNGQVVAHNNISTSLSTLSRHASSRSRRFSSQSS
jgi:hypothetical protein